MSRTFLAAGEQQVKLVALNPTQSNLALVQATIGEESRAAQVGLVSLLNGNLKWSGVEVWGDMKSKRGFCSSSSYWCPSGQRIVIWYQRSENVESLIKSSAPLGKFAVYHVKEQTLTDLTTAPPAVILGQAINASPLCPDGSGYLAMKLADRGPRFYFVTWDGWEYPLAMDEETQVVINLMGDPRAPTEMKSQIYLPLPQGVWSGSVMKFTIRRGTIAIDVKNRKISLEPLTDSEKKRFEEIAAVDEADRPWTTIQVASFQDQQHELYCQQKMGDGALSARIVLVDKKVQRRRTLLDGFVPDNFIVHHLSPSPDGQLVLACLIDGNKTGWIYVVKPDGEILTKLSTGIVRTGEVAK